METPERTRGRYALLAIAALIATSGCGNSVRELLQPLSATTAADDTGRRDALNYRIGGLQMDQRGVTGAIAAPRSDGDPNDTRDSFRARVRDDTASGSTPAKPCKTEKRRSG